MALLARLLKEGLVPGCHMMVCFEDTEEWHGCIVSGHAGGIDTAF